VTTTIVSCGLCWVGSVARRTCEHAATMSSSRSS